MSNGATQLRYLTPGKIENAFADEIGVLNFGGALPTTFDMKGEPSNQNLKPVSMDEFVAWVQSTMKR